jgi:hypothetical protein
MTVEAEVRRIYLNTVGKPPTINELTQAVDLIENENFALKDLEDGLLRFSNRSDVVNNAFETYLGRKPSEEELNEYFSKPLGPGEFIDLNNAEIIQNIKESQEGKDFAQALNSYIDAYDDVKALTTDPKYPGATEAALEHWYLYGKRDTEEVSDPEQNIPRELRAQANRVIPVESLVKLDENNKLQKLDSKYLSRRAREAIDNTVNLFRSSPGGNYEELIQSISGSKGILGSYTGELAEKDGSFNSLNDYYKQNKIQNWDPLKQGSPPPAGSFDAVYYKEQDPDAVQNWQNAQNIRIGPGRFLGETPIPNLDITERYGTLDNYLYKRYSDYGKASGLRGNPVEKTTKTQEYEEQPTDQEIATFRDQYLGMEEGSLLGQRVKGVIDSRDAQVQQAFGALAQDVLKQATEKLKKEKEKEAVLDVYKSLPSVREVFDINKTLSNSFLGDTGIGGILSIMGGKQKTEDELEESFSKITGIKSSNSTIYNWQKWFDDTLTKRYEEISEIESPTDAEKTYEVDAELAQSFINNYLKPRFDQSKSMDEFISYIDVQEEDQNIFQTQSATNALNNLAEIRAKSYLNRISGTTTGFDSTFYMNPTGAILNEERGETESYKEDFYNNQRNIVQTDWENAKENGDTIATPDGLTWNQLAYKYGLDLNDKDQFARLHYQVKGNAMGLDGKYDSVNPNTIQNYINNVVIPEVENANLEYGNQPFLEFETPEEFADSLLNSVDPTQNKEEWNKILEMYGLDSTTASVSEVKNYIIEALRTGEAQNIRESIKYLNERDIKPTQSRLGVSYIERPEDEKKVETKGDTPLYSLFKGAGYEGSQEDFYEDFMPDVSREEQEFLTQGLSGDLSFSESLSSGDPFEALTTITSLFGQQEEDVFASEPVYDSDRDRESSYFRIFEEEPDDGGYQKSKAGQSFISEFSSIFK